MCKTISVMVQTPKIATYFLRFFDVCQTNKKLVHVCIYKDIRFYLQYEYVFKSIANHILNHILRERISKTFAVLKECIFGEFLREIMSPILTSLRYDYYQIFLTSKNVNI